MTASTNTDNLDTSMRLDGKTAVVTGASSGIGRAIALELANAGANVVVHYCSNAAGAQEVVDTVRNSGRKSISIQADLSDPTQQNQLCDQAWSWDDAVNVWINNAGVDVLTGEAAQLSFEEKLDRLWRVDVAATMRIGRNIGQRMKTTFADKDKGVILNVGWDQAATGMSGDSGEMFAAVKGAVMAFTKSLAKTLAPSVRVNCLAPGWIKTSWGEDASTYWQDMAVKQSLLKRWGTPQDVARVARFLSSPAADFITGESIPINGGFIA